MLPPVTLGVNIGGYLSGEHGWLPIGEHAWLPIARTVTGERHFRRSRGSLGSKGDGEICDDMRGKRKKSLGRTPGEVSGACC